MPVTEAEIEQAVGLIACDLMATEDWDEDQAREQIEPFLPIIPKIGRVFEDAANMTLWLAENVQQRMHDLFVDTTWPTCPFISASFVAAR